ncbi:MAG: cytochrome B [Gammaproteobacteria bacterium RIFCSPHIGHO2_12_FULL_41_15]|nr:MAG: cytochrome B [Gammaproteobacteria bacterium RIFCSPHIGHO2_12_FULL_41_15]
MASKLKVWIDDRFPMTELWENHVSKYYAPKNLNFWYLFGVFSLLVLLNQIITGIWLAMYYTPTGAEAFDSVEQIMRNVKYGWLLRYMHSTGASAFFAVIYLHMYRGIMYGSYKGPRELLWVIGMVILVVLLIEAVTGYVLPWGQMSFWATKVLISVFSVIPFVGKYVITWLQGDYNVSGITLHRFFSFHVVLLPLAIIALTLVHVMALHKVGSNNPEGIEIKACKDSLGRPLDGIPFHPYYTLKDLVGVVIFLIVFFLIVFYAPTFGGYFIEAPNFVPANPLVTPPVIVPPWYLASFYSILRAVPNKLMGVIVAAAAVAFLFVLPWLDRSPVKSIRYRGVWSKLGLTVFVISFAGLGVVGTMSLTPLVLFFSRFFTVTFFMVFLTMPFYTKHEHCKRVPDRVTKG